MLRFERTQLEGFVGGRLRAMTLLCERRLRRKALQPGTIVGHLFAVVGARQGARRSAPEVPVQISWSRPTTRAAHSTSRLLILCPTQPGMARRSEPSTSWHLQPRLHRWRWLRAVERVLEVPPKSRCLGDGHDRCHFVVAFLSFFPKKHGTKTHKSSCQYLSQLRALPQQYISKFEFSCQNCSFLTSGIFEFLTIEKSCCPWA